MKCAFSERAFNQLIEIETWISQHSPQGAATILRKIAHSLDLLRTAPRAGAWDGELTAFVLRVGGTPYNIVYEIHEEANQCLVLSIRDGRRLPGPIQ